MGAIAAIAPLLSAVGQLAGAFMGGNQQSLPPPPQAPAPALPPEPPAIVDEDAEADRESEEEAQRLRALKRRQTDSTTLLSDTEDDPTALL